MKDRLYVRTDVTFTYELDLSDPTVRPGVSDNLDAVEKDLEKEIFNLIMDETDPEFQENLVVHVTVYAGLEPYL